MRDRTRSRRYSVEREEFRREHLVRRAWGKFRHHTERLRRVYGDAGGQPAGVAGGRVIGGVRIAVALPEQPAFLPPGPAPDAAPISAPAPAAQVAAPAPTEATPAAPATALPPVETMTAARLGTDAKLGVTHDRVPGPRPAPAQSNGGVAIRPARNRRVCRHIIKPAGRSLYRHPAGFRLPLRKGFPWRIEEMSGRCSPPRFMLSRCHSAGRRRVFPGAGRGGRGRRGRCAR